MIVFNCACNTLSDLEFITIATAKIMVTIRVNCFGLPSSCFKSVRKAVFKGVLNVLWYKYYNLNGIKVNQF